MRIDKTHLLNTIYKYYPSGLESADEEYDGAPETHLKLRVINQRKTENAILFSKLFHRVRAKANENVSDQSPIYDREFCNYLRYDTRIENYFFRFHILLSFLEPFHCIIITCYDQKYEKLIFTCDYDDITENDFSESQQSAVLFHTKMINGELTNLFKTSRVRMSELLDIIPDIATGHEDKGNVRFFDCLFTSSLEFF